GFARDTYTLTARFTNLGQLRPNAPVKVGGVTIGHVAGIDLDPARFDTIVTLAIDSRFNEIPIDTSAQILTGGLLGESYVGLQPAGALGWSHPGDALVYTRRAVDLSRMVGKYMSSCGGDDGGAAAPAPAGSDAAGDTPSPTEPTE